MRTFENGEFLDNIKKLFEEIETIAKYQKDNSEKYTPQLMNLVINTIIEISNNILDESENLK